MGASEPVAGKGLKPLERWANRINRDRGRRVARARLADLVAAAERHLATGNRRCLSAASKAYWMMFLFPIAVYDSGAKAGLRKLHLKFRDKDYKSYQSAWMSFFNQNDVQESVRQSCVWLLGSPFAKDLCRQQIICQQQLATWVETKWFRGRVVDQFLRLVARPAVGDEIPAVEWRILTGSQPTLRRSKAVRNR